MYQPYRKEDFIVMIKVIGIIVAVFIGFFVFRKIQEPKPQTERLAMTVWAAFGPYDTAEEAEMSLRIASRAVFGSNGVAEHENWIEGHVKNFHDWETENKIKWILRLMRSGFLFISYGRAFNEACQKRRMDALEDAQVALNGLGKDFSPVFREAAQRTINHHRESLGLNEESD